MGSFVKEHECHEGFDDEYQTYILDEDKLCDLLEPMLAEGGDFRANKRYELP